MNIAHYINRFQLQPSQDLEERSIRIGIYKDFLSGDIYDFLSPFDCEYQEKLGRQTYIPLRNRKPSVIYPIPKIIVNDSVSMLFGESHFPEVRCKLDNKDKAIEIENYVNSLAKHIYLKDKMLLAAKTGSVSSVGIIVKILEGQFYLEIVDPQFACPVWDKNNPHKLVGIKEVYKVKGNELARNGYSIENMGADYWWGREITDMEEVIYNPWTLTQNNDVQFKPIRDESRTSQHGLGCVPAVWIKNIDSMDEYDGECTFSPILDMSVEINYQLSQLGRLLRYNSDPTIVVKNPAALEGNQIIKGSGILEVDEDGDAKLLEMSGASTKAVIDYVKVLREYALEGVRGNRSSPDKVNFAQSGKALQMLNYPLVSLVDEMRMTYGKGLIQIFNIIIKCIKSGKYQLQNVENMPDFSDINEVDLVLDWPDWYPLTDQDKLAKAQTLKTFVDSQNLSHESALTSISEIYHVTDVQKEMQTIANEQEVLYKNGAKITETITG